MSETAQAAGLGVVASLQKSERMPGSPMNAIQDSAHWLTQGWWLTAMDKPRTIHDFGGFPQELFDQQYPAPGAPMVAKEMSRALVQPPVGLDTTEWD